MKKYIITTLIILLVFALWNCEKDDICASEIQTTPKLVIEFYDSANPSKLKNVSYLRVAEPTFENGYSFNAVNTINIPLRTNQDTSTLNFVLNGSDSDPTNDVLDAITFNYSRTETYISRACGYKTTFILKETEGLIIPTNNWILNYEIIQYNINNEDETHVKIYF